MFPEIVQPTLLAQSHETTHIKRAADVEKRTCIVTNKRTKQKSNDTNDKS